MVVEAFANVVAVRLVQGPDPPPSSSSSSSSSAHRVDHYQDLAQRLADAYLFEGVVPEALQKEVEVAEAEGGLAVGAVSRVEAAAHEYFGQGWDAVQGGVSKGEADFAGDYAEYDGVLFEGVEGVSVLGAEGGLFSKFV